MYFNLRLFALTSGLRPRIALAAFVGLAALAAGMARLALTGWLIGRVFQGEVEGADPDQPLTERGD